MLLMPLMPRHYDTLSCRRFLSFRHAALLIAVDIAASLFAIAAAATPPLHAVAAFRMMIDVTPLFAIFHTL